MTEPSPEKTALTDDDNIQFHLVVPDSGGMTEQEAYRFLARPVPPVPSSTQTTAPGEERS